MQIEEKKVGAELLKPERVQVICPACGQQVEAVSRDGRVKGYCGVAKRNVDFQIEIKLERAELSEARRLFYQSPEYRAKQSAAQKKLWQDPEYRAKLSATRKKLSQDPEYRAKLSAAQKKLWQDPEYQAKLSEGRDAARSKTTA